MAATKEMVAATKDKREELTEAMKQERDERLQRCKSRIEAVLKSEKCILTANISTREAAVGQFVLVGEPAIRAL
jgi:hypothetical protein